MQIVFATNNVNKIKEVQALLPKSIQIISLESIGCLEDIPETANTIEGNAIQLLIVLIPLTSAVIAAIAIRRTSTRQMTHAAHCRP